MINASNEFKHLNLGKDKRDYLEYADVTLKDGTELHLENKDFWNGGMTFEDAVSSDNSFDIGAAIINKCDLTLVNIDDRFSDYDFDGAEVVPYVGLALDEIDPWVGRNLLLGTKDFSGNNWIQKDRWHVESEKYNGLTVLSRSDTWNGVRQAFNVKKGETYTFSMYVRSSTKSIPYRIYCGLTDRDAYVQPNILYLNSTTKWERITHKFTVIEDGIAYFRAEKTNDEDRLYICGYKLERGDVATAYSIAPEDIRIEKLRKGTFTVDETKYNGSIITLSCLDNMRLFDRPYSESKLEYPASLGTIVRNACTTCGVVLQTTTFPHNDFVIDEKPNDEATTFREIISWAAQIAGCFARCDAWGRLELKWYDRKVLEDPVPVNWGVGENLILESRFQHSGASEYTLFEEFQLNEPYTLTIWGSLGSGSSSFTACIDNEHNILANATWLKDGVYRAVVNKPSWDADYPPESKKKLIVFANGAASCRIDKVKLEYGIVEEPVWTNAPSEENAHWLHSNYSSPVTSLDDVVITGVRVVEKNDSEDTEEQLTTYQEGEDGYVISVENNELIKNGTGQTVAGWLGAQLNGMRFRKAQANHASDPTIEAGDIAVLTDRKGNDYNLVVSSTKFSTGSAQNTQCSAENPARNSAARYSAETKNYVEWRKAVQQEKTQRELALEDLSKRLENTSGAYTTVEQLQGGGSVFYLHNKPKLEESDMVWKMTAEAWGVSTDGGKNWNAGMTVDGDTIVRILNAVGVNASWINAGRIEVKDADGNTIFLVDMDTKQIIISGDNIRIGGKSATQALADNLKESKDYTDGKLSDYADTVTKDFANVQKQIDGQIESYFEDYEPSMKNKPAVDWTSENDRLAHEGDIFYWEKEDGTSYAYRFMKDSTTSAWGWNLLRDTDITKAIADAAHAQDTADHKRRTFLTQPQPPYDEGDLWYGGTDKDVLVCKKSRESGAYDAADWGKADRYIDQSAAEQVASDAIAEISQTDILNKLTNNGLDKGIYLLDGHLYISFNAARGGDLILGGADNKNGRFSIHNSYDIEVGYIDNTGVYFDRGTIKGAIVDAKGLEVKNSSDTTTFSVSSTGDVTLIGKISVPRYNNVRMDMQNGDFRYYEYFPSAQSEYLVSSIKPSTGVMFLTTHDVDYVERGGVSIGSDNTLISSRFAVFTNVADPGSGEGNTYTIGNRNVSQREIYTYPIFCSYSVKMKSRLTVEGTTTLASAPTISSDENVKHDILDIDPEQARQIILNLEPKTYKYDDGTSGRTHRGFTVQGVKRMMDKLEIDSQDYAAYVIDEDGKGYIRYEEFLADIVSMQQTHDKEITELKATIADLKQQISDIKSALNAK